MSNTAGSEMLSVLIIGCGNIAGGFDAAGSNTVLTHAGAYRRHGGFRLAGCVEPDAGRRTAFQQRWGIEHTYASLPEALGSGTHYDVISVCSPTPQHAADLNMVLRASPRLVFCEKPLAAEIKEATGLVAACRDAGILLAVNYTRRWDPEISAFKSALERGVWGPVRSAVGYYNKGVLNNGSHMVDLLQHLLGPLELQATGTAQSDHSAEDPTVPALLATTNATPVHLATGAAGDYALFELQVVTAKGVVAIEQGGFSWRERLVRESPRFAGYHDIGDDTQRPGGYPKAMLRAATNIHEALTQGAELASTGETALAAQTICDQIRQRALAAGRS
jgi:predicted dehydrogenase